MSAINESIVKILIENINSSNEINFTKETCNNIIKQNLSDLNEDDTNNFTNAIFQNEETMTKQDILNKLSSLKNDENTENNNNNNNDSNNNNNNDNNNNNNDNDNNNNKNENENEKNENENEDINIHLNEKEIIQPSNNIKMPVINIKPREHKNRDIKNNTIDVSKENEKRKKEILNYDKTTKNKIETPTKSKIFDKMNIFRNEFFSPKNPLPSKPLPINIKTRFSSEINTPVKKHNKINLGIKNYDINDENQRKQYVNDIKGKLKNFAEEKKVRENKEKEIKSPFDDINDMIQQFQNKKKEN